jgi:hypothetical protein
MVEAEEAYEGAILTTCTTSLAPPFEFSEERIFLSNLPLDANEHNPCVSAYTAL